MSKTLTKQQQEVIRPPFDKVVCLGSQDNHNVFCNIQFRDDKLSITGVVGPKSNGDAWGSCGQIVGAEINRANIEEGWTQELIKEFYAIWDAWHLNDMQAGCEHQRAEGWDDKRIDPKEIPNCTANRDERGILAIWVRKGEHPKGLLCEPCTTCGYKYGTAWLKKEVPYHVLNFLRCNVKQTQKHYYWV